MKLISGNIFRRYAVSYLSIVLVVCAVLGMVLQAISAAELQKSENEIYASRLDLAAAHIERQFSVMENIRLKVKTDMNFMPFFLRQHYYNDKVLLEQFTQFSYMSDWVRKCYLWYTDAEKIYTSSNTCSLDVFIRSELGISEADFKTRLYQQVEETEDMGLTVLQADPEQEKLLFCLPLRYGTPSAGWIKAALFFMVSREQIQKEIMAMTHVKNASAFALSYNGTEIVSDQMENPITARGTNGKVQLSLSRDCFDTSGAIDSYHHMTLLAMLAVLVFGVCLAIWAAYRNYRPIHSLYSKYVKTGEQPTNELQTIETLLINSHEDMNRARKQMDQQLQMLETQQAYLKQQLVMMLISGSDSPVVSRQIEEMGYQLTHDLYAILFLHLNGSQNTADLIRDVEAFSDEAYSLYAAELQPEKEYAVLLNFDDEDQIQELLELMGDMLVSRGLTARAQVSRPCHSLNDIASTAIAALNARFIQLPAPDEDAEVDHEDERGLEQVLTLAEEGQLQQALAQLDTIIAMTNSRYPSYIMRIYILNSLAQRIHSFALQNGVVGVQGMMTSSADSEALSERMRQMVRMIGANQAVSETAEPYRGGEVAAYIREHCLDSDISLLSIAETMGISTKQVTRQLRCAINKTFKEYLVELRMDKAKQLLRDETLPIAEIAERVGYFNVSYFIKSFKEYIGVTPGKWRKFVDSHPDGDAELTDFEDE